MVRGISNDSIDGPWFSRLLRLQILGGVALTGACLALLGWREAASLAVGVALAILLAWHMRRGLARAGRLDAQGGRRVLFSAAAVRYLSGLALLLLLWRMGVSLPWLAGGFFVAQGLAYGFFFHLFWSAQHGKESNPPPVDGCELDGTAGSNSKRGME